MTAQAPAIRKPLAASPCIGICELDQSLGLCRGCARTGEEIALWRDAGEEWRRGVWEQLPGRIAELGINIRRLSWEPGEILDFVADSLERAAGAWRFGVWGAEAEFRRRPGEPVEIRRGGETVEATTVRAALRIRAPRGARALAWRERADAPERIVLALPKARLGEPGPQGLTALGSDGDALLPSGLGVPRFDLGLGRAEARVTVRCADAALAARLASAEGMLWPDHLDATGEAILAAAATRVVETPLGRAEIAPAPPSLGAEPPEGPRASLAPERIAQRLPGPPGLQTPKAYAVGCVFHPDP